MELQRHQALCVASLYEVFWKGAGSLGSSTEVVLLLTLDALMVLHCRERNDLAYCYWSVTHSPPDSFFAFGTVMSAPSCWAFSPLD